MHRQLQEELFQWQVSQKHEPILLRGARQVGKTYLVTQFAKQAFKSFINLNFELMPHLTTCFTDLNPNTILTNISATLRKPIIPGTTLLFLDEIQLCPHAISSLRYFKELLPELHVIGAGSLLEFTLNNDNLQMPVGRIKSIFVKPLSFREYLIAQNYEELIEVLKTATITSPVPEAIHHHLDKLLREYFVLGGMPEVISDYLEDGDLLRAQAKHASIMNTYRSDFGKYAKKAKHEYMQKIFDKAPGLIGRHFQYSKIDPDTHSRDIKLALQYLVDAGIVHRVHSTQASGLPLNGLINEKKFKLIFLDIGLAKAYSQLDPQLMLSKELILLNKGALAEQFVGQELLTIVPSFLAGELYYWARDKKGSQAEVDYVINVDDQIIPIEVKAGKTGTLRSIQSFINEKATPFGVRISQHPLAFDNQILSIPLYMIAELPRLVRTLLHEAS